jgi:hypothetical protein
MSAMVVAGMAVSEKMHQGAEQEDGKGQDRKKMRLMLSPKIVAEEDQTGSGNQATDGQVPWLLRLIAFSAFAIFFMIVIMGHAAHDDLLGSRF